MSIRFKNILILIILSLSGCSSFERIDDEVISSPGSGSISGQEKKALLITCNTNRLINSGYHFEWDTIVRKIGYRGTYKYEGDHRNIHLFKIKSPDKNFEGSLEWFDVVQDKWIINEFKFTTNKLYIAGRNIDYIDRRTLEAFKLHDGKNNSSKCSERNASPYRHKAHRREFLDDLKIYNAWWDKFMDRNKPLSEKENLF